MAKIWGVILVMMISLVCCTSSVTNHLPIATKNEANTLKSSQGDRVQEYRVDNSSGVVVLNKIRYGKNDFIHIYNEDGSLWYKFTFYDNHSLERTKPDFMPISFHLDYFVLALKCVGKNEENFEVVVNEETGMKKYVRVDDPILKFQTWEEHILQVFAVEFNWKDNALLEKPNGMKKGVTLSKEVTLEPVAIEGEWLKVRWGGETQAKEKKANSNFGWIRWKKDGYLQIELYYFS